MNLEPENILNPAPGRLLIAAPFMQDSSFGRTVILLIDHDEEGSFGFILNKYGTIKTEAEKLKIPGLNSQLGWGGRLRMETSITSILTDLK